MPHIREYREEDAEAVARMWRESAPAWPGGGPGGGEHSTAARVRQEQRDLNTLATYIAWAPDPEGGQGNGRRPGSVAVGYLSLFEQPERRLARRTSARSAPTPTGTARASGGTCSRRRSSAPSPWGTPAST